jgi:hypothetical protein
MCLFTDIPSRSIKPQLLCDYCEVYINNVVWHVELTSYNLSVMFGL